MVQFDEAFGIAGMCHGFVGPVLCGFFSAFGKYDEAISQFLNLRLRRFFQSSFFLVAVFYCQQHLESANSRRRLLLDVKNFLFLFYFLWLQLLI